MSRQVPSFETRPLKNLCVAVVDCPHSTPTWLDEGKLVLRNYNIKNGHIDLSEPSYTDEETFNQRNVRIKPKPGDLVISREAPMGEVAIIPDGLELCLGQRMVLLRADETVCDPHYLLYAMLSEYVQTQIAVSDSSGSTVSNLCIPDLEALEIPYRPLSEQHRIASVLSSIDDKIENNKRLMAELEATARLVYDEWFVRFDFPDENGRPYRSSGGTMVWNDELKREIPAEWEAGLLGQLGDIVSGATPSTSTPENYSNGTISWVTPNDLSKLGNSMFIWAGERSISERGLSSCSAQLMPAGSVLMSSRAPIGYLAIAGKECCTNQGCKSLVPSKGYGTSFIYFSLKHFMPLIESQGAGTTFKEVSGSVLGSIGLPLPGVKLASTFEQVIESLMGEEKAAERELSHLVSLRDWLLPMLMNGQVKVG